MLLTNLPIVVRGAREHNLQNVHVTLPRNQLICFTGVSGSGKSSLAFDTIFAEGQRRYLESLSTYARQFIGQLPKPDVDFLSGLSPSISISQKASGHNPRSTVGTMTEINDFLRVLFARVGTGFCPTCDAPITAQTRDQIVARIASLPTGPVYIVLAPMIRGQKGEYRELFDDLRKQGFNRARVDGQIINLADPPALEKQLKHTIEVVIDRVQLSGSSRARIAEAVDTAIRLGEGTMLVLPMRHTSASPTPLPVVAEIAEKKVGKNRRKANAEQATRLATDNHPTSGPGDEYGEAIVFSAQYACAQCGTSYPPPSPQLLSFNSPLGMCHACNGLGELYTMDPELLIPDAKKSLRSGAIALLGNWARMSRWQRVQLQGVSSILEPMLGIAKGELLKTPWRSLSEKAQQLWLYGTGEQSVTFTLRGGRNPKKFSGHFEGIIPQLVSAWNNFKNPMQRRQYEKFMHQLPCKVCKGQRLNAQARFVRLESRSLTSTGRVWYSMPDVGGLPLAEALFFFQNLVLNDIQKQIAVEALKEICGRLGFLLEVGLNYLSLDRPAPSLSGGESQRIRLASQIGSGLVGVTYVLDEPSIGLHPRDNDRLLNALKRLRDLGNSVLVVEHDEDTMRAADLIVDFGPGPGIRGGQLIVQGTAEAIAANSKSLTGQYLSGRATVASPKKRRLGSGECLRLLGANQNNLQNIDVDFPLGCLVCVTGVSGSGKSSLITDVLTPYLRHQLNGAEECPKAFQEVSGLEHLDKIIDIDQSPIGRTPRSNPATYVKVFDEIRDLYAKLPESKKRGYAPGRFSFNTDGGRCSACEGNGSTRLDMEMLADLWVTCPVCNGRRYDYETLQVLFKGKSIADCLEMDIQEALEHFQSIPRIVEKLQTLHDVGLDYLKLGQPSPTLSGGEAQRIKLAKELSRRATGRTLYVLDEPTTGLHFHDINMLLSVLQSLVDRGNTVIVIEHNLDLIQAADWVIDLGPEGGAAGGRIVATGTPEDLAKQKRSATGVALARHFKLGRAKQVSIKKQTQQKSMVVAERVDKTSVRQLVLQGASMHNLQDVNLTLNHGEMSVFCGKSGSGKTSLAIDTIYAEGQRRYTESLSSYARQFVGQMPKPTVHTIEGLAPSVALEQRSLGHTPRSTVGTVTEIYDYFRVLMARLATMHCPECDDPVGTQTLDQVVDRVMSLPQGTRALILAPIESSANRELVLDQAFFDNLKAQGYVRVRLNGQTTSIDDRPELAQRGRYHVEVVIDRIKVDPKERSRIADSLETALGLGSGLIRIAIHSDDLPEPRWETLTHSLTLACHRCGLSFLPLTPHSFSFNTQLGWCSDCDGLGVRLGTNPAALLDSTKSLAEGGLLLWPGLDQRLSLEMLQTMCAQTGIPIDIPIGAMTVKHRNMLLFGTGEQSFAMSGFSFRFRGAYPTLDIAARSSQTLRIRLESYTAEVECLTCRGSRLRPEAAKARFRELTIAELVAMPLGELLIAIQAWKLNSREQKIAGELIREIVSRLSFLVEVGLDYLTLGRSANSLSGGEAQRIRLAAQLGSGLCGVLYVLDEPTIGLHPRDNHRLVKALHRLRDLGNTLIVVEHDRDVIASSDSLCDFGPGSGHEGGHIVAQGTPDKIAESKTSVTGPYLSGRKAIPIPSNRRISDEATTKIDKAVSRRRSDWMTQTIVAQPWLGIRGAKANTLRNVDVDFPLGCLIAVTGPSGSGKSSLINEVLYPALARQFHHTQIKVGPHRSIEGLKFIDKVVRVDQSPLGSSPSSTPATYTGVFDLIRELYAKLPEAKVRGFTSRQFSFNVPGGRCEKCEGNGRCRIEMHFLPDVWVECDACHGRRYTEETLSVRYQGKSIHDLLTMKIGQVRDLLINIPKIRRILTTLCDVGLDYVALGQSAPTLSGGEAQRVKLAAELSRPDTGRTLYLLDEPTTGLHFDDIAKLLRVLHRLVDIGNTVVVIEHNLDVIKTCDWVIELGPEAGWRGGQVVFGGTPEKLVAYARDYLKNTGPKGRVKSKIPPTTSRLRCHTGEALEQVLKSGPYEERVKYDPMEASAPRSDDQSLSEIAQQSLSPWQVDGRKWHLETGLDRRGKPVLWERSMLRLIIERIEASSICGDIDWNSNSVVEIPAKTRSRGWFLHAFTAESAWLKLKFRIPKGYFTKSELLELLKLPPLSQLEGISVFNREARTYVEVGNDWQEVELRPHLRSEIDRPAFWDWLAKALHAFAEATADH